MGALGWFVAGWAASKILGSDDKNESENFYEQYKKKEAEKRAEERERRIKELEDRLKRLEDGERDDYRHQDLRGW